MRTRRWISIGSLGLAFVPACAVDPADAGPGASESTGAGESSSTGEPDDPDRETIVHSFGVLDLAPLEETSPCLQWTLNNEAPIYVQTVRLTNDGGSHHSNWFAVPEDAFAGPDGYYNCAERGFQELDAAVAGTVLFAQSTQSRIDEQPLPEGVVIKIPPRHKIVAGGHFLNLADAPYRTEMRMALELVHPKLVEVVAAPFRLTYYDLALPAMRESRFSADCDMSATYVDAVGRPLDLKLYYVTPHYHYLGNWFDLFIEGGERDGENLFHFDGFNGSSNGKSFDPPIDMTGADGFRFTCGYDNWRDREIGWGIGDQEMCVMLGLADSAVLMDASVSVGAVVGEQDGVVMNEGACSVVGLPKNEAQGMPGADEIAAELYVPPVEPGDAELPPVPECVDQDLEAVPHEPLSLASISATLFESSCSYSSCHGPGGAGGINLRADDLYAELFGHEVRANTSMPLITPGDPDKSWLYTLL
ncbi:MAG: hypothetical protein IAG13_21475, partial [Deltaproteobacteria bacterium]|nr:hypothetical protein [Nannocystaceae bacterium]